MKSLTIELVCRICNEKFVYSPSHYAELGIYQAPVKCPKCTDMECFSDKKIVLEREEIAFIESVELVYFPKKMEISNNGKFYHCHWDSKDIAGKYPICEGDLSVFSLKERKQNDIVDVRIMKVINAIPSTGKTQEYTYLYLASPTSPSPIAKNLLVASESHYKHTLKGLGRQISEPAVFVPENYLWSMDFHTYYRSLRAKRSVQIFIIPNPEM